jgi:hypothetical protein
VVPHVQIAPSSRAEQATAWLWLDSCRTCIWTARVAWTNIPGTAG